MELTFLGTASAYPTPTRGVSCIIFRNEGTYWMFDCGEGSQIQLMKSKVRPGKISRIFITHLHGDHLFGLPGLLCTISQNYCPDLERPVIQIYGPTGLRLYLRLNLLVSQSQLGFNYTVHELVPLQEQWTKESEVWQLPQYPDDGVLHPNELPGSSITASSEGVWSVCEDDRHIVKAGWLQHRIPSFGYTVQEKPLPGRLDPALLKAKGIPPGPLYSRIKAGETITAPSGETIQPSDVLGPSRPGRLVALLGDSSDSHQMAALCKGADVIVHEATLEDSLEENALEKGHSTPGMAGRFAESVGAKRLVLTHFSQRYKGASQEPEDTKDEECSVAILTHQAQAAFGSDDVIAADDLMTITIPAR